MGPKPKTVPWQAECASPAHNHPTLLSFCLVRRKLRDDSCFLLPRALCSSRELCPEGSWHLLSFFCYFWKGEGERVEAHRHLPSLMAFA